jgi:hypothetical protein
MTRKKVERQNTSWRISVEAKRLLERMSDRSSISQAAVLEQAIREKAQREKITLDADTADGARSQQAAFELTPEEKAAVERLHQLAQKVRTGEDVPPEEIRREIDVLRAEIPISSLQRTGPPDPAWRERVQRMLELVRAGVPEEWTEEELQERVQKVVDEVRADRRARGEWPPAVPTFASPQQKALMEALQELVDATRTRFDQMTPDQIEQEVERIHAQAGANQRADRR